MTKQNQNKTRYQRKFQDSDMIWLANEYHRRSKSDPSLTLEDFSVQYGVMADELRTHIPELNGGFSNSVILFHGTSKKRAESILNQGFRVKRTKNHGIYFTKDPGVARNYAENRARSEGDEPAVIMCSIDLDHYVEYERRGMIFVFHADCVGSEVVKQVNGLHKRPHEKAEKKTNDSPDVRVSLTFSSSPAGIAYWINSYLGLKEPDEIGEDHEVVGKIKQWLDRQVDSGAYGAVADSEVIEMLNAYYYNGKE